MLNVYSNFDNKQFRTAFKEVELTETIQENVYDSDGNIVYDEDGNPEITETIRKTSGVESFKYRTVVGKEFEKIQYIPGLWSGDVKMTISTTDNIDLTVKDKIIIDSKYYTINSFSYQPGSNNMFKKQNDRLLYITLKGGK